MTLKITDCTDRDEKTRETDPLLALAGTLKWNNISGPNAVLIPEILVIKGAHEDNPDPLLALAGNVGM